MECVESIFLSGVECTRRPAVEKGTEVLTAQVLYTDPVMVCPDAICQPSVDAPKACFSMTALNMPNRVGANKHHCFTPLRMLKASDEAVMINVYKNILSNPSSFRLHLMLSKI